MIQDYIKLVEEELNNTSYPSDPSELYEPIDYILSLGGKRIRPVVCLMTAELFGADIHQDKILKVAKSPDGRRLPATVRRQ